LPYSKHLQPQRNGFSIETINQQVETRVLPSAVRLSIKSPYLVLTTADHTHVLKLRVDLVLVFYTAGGKKGSIEGGGG